MSQALMIIQIFLFDLNAYFIAYWPLLDLSTARDNDLAFRPSGHKSSDGSLCSPRPATDRLGRYLVTLS